MKDTKADLGSGFKQCNQMMAQVGSQTGRIANLIARKKSQAEREEEKHKSQVINIAVKAAAKAKAATRQGTAAAAAKAKVGKRACQVFDSLDKIKDHKDKIRNIKEVAVEAGKPFEIAVDDLEPVLLTGVGFVAGENEFSEVLGKFTERWMKSDYYTDSGRGAQLLSGGAKTSAPPCPVAFSGTKVRHGLTPADCQYIDNPWAFALAHNKPQAGPEFCGLHSVKLQHHGQRAVVIASFEKLELFVRGTVGIGGTVSLARVVDTIAEANVATLTAMLQAGCDISRGVQEEGIALLVPWGCIVCEVAQNSDDVCGVRWTCVGDSTNPSFDNLASYMVPADAQQLKSNNTAALLAKVVAALAAPAGAAPLRALPAPPPGRPAAGSGMFGKPGKPTTKAEKQTALSVKEEAAATKAVGAAAVAATADVAAKSEPEKPRRT